MTNTGLALPAIKGRQGSRTMYLVLPENAVLNTFFTAEMEPAEDRSQRQLDPRHAREIGDYMTANPSEYALGAITYAVDVEGEFEEFSAGSGVGVLRLPLNARLRSVDGQHRRAAIKQAIDSVEEFGKHHTALLIYVENDLAKRRQIFSDMNNTPRKVSKAVNVAFDSRDPFARAVNRVVVDHPMLMGRVETKSARVRPGSSEIFTLGSVHDAAKRLFVGPNGRVKDPAKYTEQGIYDRTMAFFDLLSSARPEFATTTSVDKLEKYRNETILFSSTTLRVLAGAVWRLQYESSPEMTTQDLVGKLSQVDFRPTSKMWTQSGFISPGKSTPNARTQELQAATDALVTGIRSGAFSRSIDVTGVAR